MGSGGELSSPECDFSVLKRPDWSTRERIELFEKMIESGKAAPAIVEAEGLAQISDTAAMVPGSSLTMNRR